MTQSPDGVFEAVPIQAWYSLNPTISYSTLSHEDVEKEFAKRDRTLNYHNLMLQKRIKDAGEPDDTSILGDKVKSMYRDDLVSFCHHSIEKLDAWKYHEKQWRIPRQEGGGGGVGAMEKMVFCFKKQWKNST